MKKGMFVIVYTIAMMTEAAAHIGDDVPTAPHGARFANPVIGGKQVQCKDSSGRTVDTVSNHMINDVGIAISGEIHINPHVLFQYPAAIQLFWYAHECAHHSVGADERKADCLAARVGKEQGWFNDADLREMSKYMAANPGDATHLPGPGRVQDMLTCMQSKSEEFDRRAVDGDDCGALQRALASASGDFAELRSGDVDTNKDGTRSWDGRPLVPKAECSVWKYSGNEHGSAYSCELFHGEMVEADELYRQWRMKLSSCFRSAKFEEEHITHNRTSDTLTKGLIENLHVKLTLTSFKKRGSGSVDFIILKR